MEPVVSLVQVGGNLLLKLLHQTRGGYIALTILVIIWSAFVTRELAEYLPYTLLDSVIESNCITYHYVVFQNIEVGVHPLGIGPASVFCPYSQFRLRAKRGLRLPAGAQRTADAIYLCSTLPYLYSYNIEPYQACLTGVGPLAHQPKVECAILRGSGSTTVTSWETESSIRSRRLECDCMNSPTKLYAWQRHTGKSRGIRLATPLE